MSVDEIAENRTTNRLRTQDEEEFLFAVIESAYAQGLTLKEVCEFIKRDEETAHIERKVAYKFRGISITKENPVLGYS